MKSKLKIYLAVPLIISAFLTLICSCGKIGNSNATGTAQAGTTSTVSLATPITQAPSADPSFPAPESDKPYVKAYYNVVRALIDQYGFYDEDGSTYTRGDLVDFDGDGTPEFVCIYIKGGQFHNVRIYTYKNELTDLLVDEETGGSINGENVSVINFKKLDGKQYLITENCDWGKVERIKVYSIKEGVLMTKSFTSDVQINDDGYAPNLQYTSFQINGKTATEKTYNEQKEYYYEGALSWWIIEENGKIHSYEKDDAIKFIKTLAAAAGIGDLEVAALLNGNN